MTEHEACIILNLLNGLGGVSAWRSRGAYIKALIEKFGSVPVVLDADADSLSRVTDYNESQADRILRWRELVDPGRELENAKNDGVTILCLTDDEYPDPLRALKYPPLCIYLRGVLPADLETRSIAIVGTRTPSDYGTRMAHDISASAARGGWTTVSGLAVGIDTAAHQGSIEAGGKTVAVLGFGQGQLHFSVNAELARAILRTGGAIVSEYPMNTETTKHTLKRRNRIIAGLSGGTVVIEAGKGSGALITATEAQNLGRGVFAVQGEADNPVAAGSNKLIQQGVKSVADFNDVLSAFRN